MHGKELNQNLVWRFYSDKTKLSNATVDIFRKHHSRLQRPQIFDLAPAYSYTSNNSIKEKSIKNFSKETFATNLNETRKKKISDRMNET